MALLACVECGKQMTPIPQFCSGSMQHMLKGYGLEWLRFVSVRSAGDLVGGTKTRYCGIFAGAETFVGMFDLPENH